MKKVVSHLMNIKTKSPNVSFIDILLDYIDDNPEFDFDEFIDFIKKKENLTLFNFIKNDLIEHGYWLTLSDYRKMMKDLF